MQRGCAPHALSCAKTKRELIASITGVRRSIMLRHGNWKKPTGVDFRSWAARTQRYANP
jgi:hypothetical protein